MLEGPLVAESACMFFIIAIIATTIFLRFSMLSSKIANLLVVSLLYAPYPYKVFL